MENLPKIFKNKIEVDNNRKYYVTKNEEVIEKKSPKIITNDKIKESLDSIFKNNYMPYSKEVNLYLDNRVLKTRLVRRYSNYLLTIDNEKIKMEDIKKIEIIN